MMRAKRSTFAGQVRWDLVMSRLKDETLSIRTSAEVKQLLKLAAERERRSLASMLEVLILDYADRNRLQLPVERATDRP